LKSAKTRDAAKAQPAGFRRSSELFQFGWDIGRILIVDVGFAAER